METPPAARLAGAIDLSECQYLERLAPTQILEPWLTDDVVLLHLKRRNDMRLPLAFGFAMVLAVPATAQEAGSTTGLEINPQSYTGVWYEIARTPTPYQEDCEGGVTATYNLIDDATMEVINRCDRASGDPEGVVGEAEVVDGNFNTFSVEFGQDTGAPGINYIVAAVGDEEAEQYPWAAVYSPD